MNYNRNCGITITIKFAAYIRDKIFLILLNMQEVDFDLSLFFTIPNR